MSKFRVPVAALALAVCSQAVHAQTPLQTSGTLVVVPASAQIRQANDEAHVTLMIEEADKDKAAAASRVNQKMRQGVDILKKEDPQAVLKTRGYYTYAVYPEDQPGKAPPKVRQPASWRVGQYVDLTTTNLNTLPKTVAAAQAVLALNGINFGLTDATTRRVDALRIEATYRNLNERIASIAKAMGRSPSDAVLETVDFEGSGNYVPQAMAAPKTMRAAMADFAPVEEPSFEPGETTLQMNVVGRVKFR